MTSPTDDQALDALEARLNVLKSIDRYKDRDKDYRAACNEAASAIAALRAQVRPREPTEVMIDAAIGIDLIETGWRKGVAILWQQMHDAGGLRD